MLNLTLTNTARTLKEHKEEIKPMLEAYEDISQQYKIAKMYQVDNNLSNCAIAKITYGLITERRTSTTLYKGVERRS